ncbi:MAG: hypothetical protein ACRDE7_03280 [Sphingobacterium sp.]
MTKIIKQDIMHAKWLNALSFMENAGARKISACEDPVDTNIIQLKHAAEEHRHAYYLKKQIKKLSVIGFQTYTSSSLLGGRSTYHYLHKLDMQVCRYLKNHFDLEKINLKYAAYLLVTYAIEIRADHLYPIYQTTLDRCGSKVMVKNIIIEEKGHLQEMVDQLKAFDPDWEIHANQAIQMEKLVFEKWMNTVSGEILANKEVENLDA